MSKKKVLFIAGAVALFLLVCCVVVMVFKPTEEELAATRSVAQTQTAMPTSTMAPTGTLLPTNTPAPTSTLGPATSTPLPTNTPEPTATATPRPISPTCSEIMQSKPGKTDAQWDKYKEDLIGLWVIDWQTTITEVSDKSFLLGGYPVHLDVTNDCRLLYIVTDEKKALELSLDQKVIITGRISSTSELFWLTISLKDVETEQKN